jgi:hypothetical protein
LATTVTVSQNGYSETIKAKVTEMIHPEAVLWSMDSAIAFRLKAGHM